MHFPLSINGRVWIGILASAALLAGSALADVPDEARKSDSETSKPANTEETVSPPVERTDEKVSEQEEDTRAPSRGDRRRYRAREGSDDMAMLDRLLSMPPEQLARVRQALERVEAMSPEEREALRERLSEFRKIPPEKRKEMRDQWKDMTLDERREHIREMRERRWERVLEDAEPSDEESPD